MKSVQIISKKYKHYTGKVYDLEVEDIHSYNIDDLIVHNSGGGSVVNNLLGITRIDPVQYDLLFERFLNPDRASLPDVDTDIESSRSGEVFQHLIDKYGKEYTANIATYQRLQMKAVIKDVGKALGIDYTIMNSFTLSIPDSDNEGPIEHVTDLDRVPEAVRFFEQYPEVKKYALALEGLPKSSSQHPAGFVVTPCPMTDLVPCSRAKDNNTGNEAGLLSVFEKAQSEQVGLVKIDLLRLNALDQLKLMIQLLKKYYPIDAMQKMNKPIALENIPLDDPATFKLICDCNTVGIFQFDNLKVAAPVLRDINPKNIHEVSAATSYIRPGVDRQKYVEAKRNPKNRQRIDPRIDNILDKTFGSICYQEQIMSILSIILNISFGQADSLRRILEKKKKYPEKYQEFYDTFIERGMKNGFSKEVCQFIRKEIIDGSGYSFNQSHAYGYSVLTLQMAWIKANYPLVFYAAMISYDLSKVNLYKPEAERIGITILRPDINLSDKFTTIESIENKTLRAGFNQVKGLGDAAIDSLLTNRPFTSINDFVKNGIKNPVNKKTVEMLIDNDCLDGLPFIFEDPSITEDSPLYGHEPLYLDRGQLSKWYEIFYNSSKGNKTEKNYLISKSDLPLNLQEDIELTFEPGDLLVVPFSKLNEFNVYGTGENGQFTEEDISKLTRTTKKAKGRLAVPKEISKLNPIFKPFLQHEEEIMSASMTNAAMFINDITKHDGVTFRLHPLIMEKDSIGISDKYIDGQSMNIAGLISNFEIKTRDPKRKTYLLTVVTPYETKTFYASRSNYEMCQNILVPGMFIRFNIYKPHGKNYFQLSNFKVVNDIVKRDDAYLSIKFKELNNSIE